MIIQKNLKDIKITNRANILRMICENPGITRQTLSNHTQLSKMSIANIVNEFLEKGIIEEKLSNLESNANAGRPSSKIFIIPDAVIVIGIYISETFITCALVNFRGDIVVSNSLVPSTKETNEELFKKIDSLLLQTLLDGHHLSKNIFGIGIASVGLIDYDRGCLLRADNFPHIFDMHLVDYYHKKFDLPTFISNDMQASAIAEKHFGNGRGINNFIYIGVNNCVGIGIYINDTLYRGFNGLAGELGYTTIDYRGKLFPCGNRGRLEYFLRIDRYIEKANKDFQKHLPDMPDFPAGYVITWPDIVTEAMKGNTYCLNIIHTIGDFLAIAITNLTNIFDPEIIVLGGQLALAEDLIITYINESVKNKSVKYLLSSYSEFSKYHETRLTLSKFINRSPVIGAGAVIYSAIFQGKLGFD